MIEMEIEDEESVGLVSQDLSNKHATKDIETFTSRRKVFVLSLVTFLILGCSLGVGLPALVKRPQTVAASSGIRSGSQKSTPGLKFEADSDEYPTFSCPGEFRLAKNVDEKSFEEVYTNVTKSFQANITEFLEGFREREFDGWDKTYMEVKAGLHDWKVKYFAENLKDGDAIFESACGIGLNLVLTLEVVQEMKELNNIRVYGNEYVPESASLANNVLDHLLPQMNASRGVVCQGDSTDLSFVPANSMDVVFTGYISTLLDPLNFDQDDDIEANYRLYDHLCKVENKDWEAQKLVEIMQERQNDWFGGWVAEMVRIAKPGAPVIVEQVSMPYCKDVEDWGGVSPAFWKAGPEKYDWDIDPASIAMEEDHVFGGRYNVFMRKNS